jgi:hypothetical protein
MKRLFNVVFTVILTAFAAPLGWSAEPTWNYSVQVSAAVQSSPARITLSWPQDTTAIPNSYAVYRKAPNATSWGAATMVPGSATSYADSSVTAGTVYEYQIVKSASGYSGYGYICSGIDVPLVENRGKVVLIVDNTYAASLAAELSRLQQDLVGDGWTVLRHDVARNDSVVNVKNLIKADYNADPANVKAVFLFGHVPVPYSGQSNPDGHADHRGALPADAYYGDMDGVWTDSSVNFIQSINTDSADAARLSNVPGDGKFDQSAIPSAVELQVGRVDLANMPGRVEWGGPATFPSELELLRQYLNKDHNFRGNLMTVPRRGLVGDYFGVRGGEAFAASGFRNFTPFFGTANIDNLNLIYNDTRGVWIPTLRTNVYLWAYGCGAGSYTSVAGLGNAQAYNTGTSTEMVSNDVKAVFVNFFGSWLNDWDHEDNIMRSILATPTHGLVSACSGRPHWFAHPMGLGETIGYTARLTQNDGNGLYANQVNPSAGGIHVALMGDPTLRMHPVAPPSALNGTVNSSGVSLSWTPSSDSILGYHIYRAANEAGPFTRLTSSLVSGTSFTDASAPAGANTYMVRAVKLESTPSGSYQNPSQGSFWTIGSAPAPSPNPTPSPDTTVPAVSISAPANNATVSGSAAIVSATASDNIGVVGVQFKLDGANLGAEITAAPYSVAWNTTTVAEGSHSLSAVARDSAGNRTTATPVAVNVSNVALSTVPVSNAAWVDDSLPAGAAGYADGGDSWNWVTSNPAPFSGTRAHQSALATGLHDHFFNFATATLPINSGDKLFAYVYLDPANPPSEVMLGWKSASGNWEHRAYWGANQIPWGTDGTASQRYMGPLPAAGQWVKLEVPASQVGLEGVALEGMYFMLFDGRATWDYAGKSSTTSDTGSGTPPSSVPPSTVPVSNTAWVDDSLPVGAAGYADGGDSWNWVTSNPAPFSGTRAHQSALATGLHDHFFNFATATLSINSGDTLFAYVYLDPANPPSEVMLGWKSASGNWEHRAYWGANQIPWGTDGTASQRFMGPLPSAGQWVKLEVPASQVGLEGTTLEGMYFMLFDGRATWDYAGKSSPSGTTTSGTTSVTPPTVTISATDAIATEGNNDNAEILLTRTGSTAAPLTINLMPSGTATKWDDYRTVLDNMPDFFTIPAGISSLRVTIVAADDTQAEGTETATLTIAEDSNYAVGSPSSATITILDKGVAPQPNTTVPPVTLSTPPTNTTASGSSVTLAALPSWVTTNTHNWKPSLGGVYWLNSRAVVKQAAPYFLQNARPVLVDIKSDAIGYGYRFDLDSWDAQSTIHGYYSWNGTDAGTPASTEDVMNILGATGNAEFILNIPIPMQLTNSPSSNWGFDGYGYLWQTPAYYGAMAQYLFGAAGPQSEWQSLPANLDFFSQPAGFNWANLRARRGHVNPYPVSAIIIGEEPYNLEGTPNGALYGAQAEKFRVAIRNRGVTVPLGLHIRDMGIVDDPNGGWFNPMMNNLTASDFSYIDIEHYYQFSTRPEDFKRTFPVTINPKGFQGWWLPKNQWKSDYSKFLWIVEDTRNAIRDNPTVAGLGDPSRWRVGFSEHGIQITTQFVYNDMFGAMNWAGWLAESMRQNIVWDSGWTFLAEGFSTAALQSVNGHMTRTPMFYVYQMAQEFYGLDYLANNYASEMGSTTDGQGNDVQFPWTTVRVFRDPATSNIHLFVVNQSTNNTATLSGFENWNVLSWKQLSGASYADGNALGVAGPETIQTVAAALPAPGTSLRILPISVNHIVLAAPSAASSADTASNQTSAAPATTTLSSANLPAVTVVATDANASRVGQDPGTFVFTRAGSSSAPLTINYALTGTVVNGTDYNSLATSVTIPAGATSASLTVVPKPSSTLVGPAILNLTLSPASAYTVGSDSRGTLNISGNTVTITSQRVLGNNFTLSWSSVPGKTYRVACKNSASDANWMDLSPDLTASGASSSWTDRTANRPAVRIYAVYVIN